MPRKGRCPSCGEPVSPFAAGCAICGEDLEAFRRREAERRARRPAIALPQVRLPSVSDDALMLTMTVLAVLFFPFLGLVLAFVGARDVRRADHRTWYLVLGGAAVLLLVVAPLRFGVTQLIWGA